MSVDSIWADMKTESNVALKPKTTKIGFVSEHACKSTKKSSSGQKKEKKAGKEKKVTKSEILAGLHTKPQTPSDAITAVSLKV